MFIAVPRVHGSRGVLVALVVLLPLAALAQTPTDFQAIHFSGDVHTTFPGDSAVLVSTDDTVLEYDLDAAFADGVNHVGVLDGADVDAFHNSGDGCGLRIFSLDATAEILGTPMRPADIFTESGTMVLDASAEGIPDGVNVDAVSREPGSCLLVFSVDTAVDLGGTVFGPGDLVSWESGSGFALYRVDNFGINIDALHLLEDGRYLISTDVDHEFSGGVARDEDVVEVIPGGPGSFQEIVFEPASLDASWGPADMDALWAMPRVEPGTLHWDVANIDFNEDGGNIGLSVERTGGADGMVSIDWATSDGTATDPDDYDDGSGTLMFDDGVTSFGVSIPIVDDGDIEGHETFTVTLSNPTGGASLGSPSTITVRIIDDEDFIFADGFED